MKIIIPTSDGLLNPHFGQSHEFVLLDLDPGGQKVRSTSTLTPPPHQPGVLPRWIADQQADVVITGGLGKRAQLLLEDAGVQVVTGAPSLAPEQVVALWQGGGFSGEENFCDH
jgi:ATP-binding protein involved in chromosome partitioning